MSVSGLRQRFAIPATAIAVCLGLILTQVSEAQTSSGAIVGTVSDISGALIPGAKVTITHTELRVVTEAQTNEVGMYSAPSLRAGPYLIRAEVPGFQASLRSGIVLHINDRLKIDFVLQPGLVSEVIDVTGGEPLIQTQSADVASLVEHRRMVDLPLDGRRYVDLMLLSPGVLPAPGVRDHPREGRINVGGNFSLQNYFVLGLCAVQCHVSGTASHPAQC